MWISKIGGRKFVISVLAVLLVCFAINVDGDSKMKFVTMIVGIYATANVIQKNEPEAKA